MFKLKNIGFNSFSKFLSFTRTGRFFSNNRSIWKTIILEETEESFINLIQLKREADIDKYAPEFYDEDLPKMLTENGLSFKDMRTKDWRYSEMKLEEITEIPKTVPHLEEFKKLGLDLPPNARELAEKTKDYRALSQMLDIAMTQMPQHQAARVLAYVYQRVPRRPPPVEDGMVPLEERYDSARVNFARVRLNYALKMKEKPFFRGEYMNELARKVAKQYYPADLEALGYA